MYKLVEGSQRSWMDVLVLGLE